MPRSIGHKHYELRFNGRSCFSNVRWMPSNRRKPLRIQTKGENDEQTLGNVWEEGTREAITDGCPFNSETIAGAMS
jgi:hypothetical protein